MLAQSICSMLEGQLVLAAPCELTMVGLLQSSGVKAAADAVGEAMAKLLAGHSSRNCTKERACFNCGGTGDSITDCAKICCSKCGELGHSIRMCKKDVDTPNKGAVPKCVESVDATPVLIVEGMVDGKEAVVGLNSFAGMGMVTADVVSDRRGECRRSKVLLQGVRLLGEVDLTVQLGDRGAAFVERAARSRRWRSREWSNACR